MGVPIIVIHILDMHLNLQKSWIVGLWRDSPREVNFDMSNRTW